MGVKTVWCTGYRMRNGKLANRVVQSYADFAIGHIRELSRLKFGSEDAQVFTNGGLNVLTHHRSLQVA